MSKRKKKTAEEALVEFVREAQPLETSGLLILKDKRTDASYVECHIQASRLIQLGTTDVPLDPDDQSEYRANRGIVENHHAFQRMKQDALLGRTFSNIVAEFTHEFDGDHPIKIIGGQHRFEAIREALEGGIDECHGLKVYVVLNTEQRLDVQLISNTNIAVSTDLFDRMQETAHGPGLRDWCQEVGLLESGSDFSDRKQRGGPLSVQLARTFITNYYLGTKVDSNKFATTNTAPVLCVSGEHDPEWESLRSARVWKDPKLKDAAREFAELVETQRSAFKARRGKPDYPEKAMNAAIVASWAYVAGVLQNNEVRLKRHFGLSGVTGKDPLNASALAAGRHKSDAENYRGLGYRTDVKERGRFVELFYYQAENGGGITATAVDVAIKKYHAKQAQLDVIKAEEQ